jgi:hypothetical protein
MDAKTKRLLDRRERLLRKLGQMERLVHGSYVERFTTCARKQCACHRGERHGPRGYVVIYRDTRQQQVYVPQEQVPAVQEGLRQDKQAAELLRQITDINLALMRAGRLSASERKPRKEDVR